MTHSSTKLSRRATSWAAVSTAAALTVVGLTACSAGGETKPGCDGEATTITLSGPNQWTSSGSSFGPAWEDLVSRFEKAEPCITLETNVLPLDSYSQTIATQLAAGNSSDLVFSGVPYDPYMVHPLTDDLEKPNPYVDGNEKWIDVFNPDYFSKDKVADSEGNIDFIPLNLVGVAMFYNQEAFEKAGISEAPATFEDLITTCDALTDAGYTPLAMDNSALGVGWTVGALSAQLLAGDLYDEWNVYDAAGDPGQADPLASKSIARALANGEFNAQLPQVQESLTLLKEMFDHCVSPDWSGTTSTSGAIVGAQQFSAGDAAMAWGVNFGVAELDSVDFEVGSMPFPTITKETTELSPGEPARFGTGLGGTSYMIPANTEGKQLDAALKFLQFVSAPKEIEPWLATSGGIPVVNDVEPAANVAGFSEGDWALPFKVSYGILQLPSTTTNANAFGGYLLGTKSLDEQVSSLQALYDERVEEDARNHPEWAGEDWRN